MATCQPIKCRAYEQTPDSPLEATNHKTYTMFSNSARLCNEGKRNATSAVGRVYCLVLRLGAVQFTAIFKPLELVTETQSHILECVIAKSRVQYLQKGTRWRSCLRHCATSRKAAVSIPDGVIRIFH